MQELNFSKFNWENYLKNYEDLRNVGFVNQQQSLKHYYNYGIHEGRTDNSLISNFKIPNPESIILFANSRDELGLKEWCAHHLLLGFDAIYIFDHLSKEPLEKELFNFDERVQTIRINASKSIKMNCMNYAKIIGTKLKAKWILYLDCDEFLILNKHDSVKDFLNTFSSDMIGINILLFGTNNLIKEPSGLVIDNYTKSENLVDQHIKCFVKPTHIKKATNPHYFIINGDFHNVLNERVNIGPFIHINLPYDKVPAYIAHYIYKSEESYINHKCELPTDDTGRFRIFDKTVHTRYNEIENFSVKERYNIGIKKYLKIEVQTEVDEVVKPELEVVKPELEVVEPELEVVEEIEVFVEPRPKIELNENVIKTKKPRKTKKT